MQSLKQVPAGSLFNTLAAAICVTSVVVAFTGCSEAPVADKTADTGPAIPTDTSPATGDSASLADSSLNDTGVTVGGLGDVAAKTDGPCVKDCAGKICGPNGCGSVCGFCLSGQFCDPDGTKCNEFCKPKCTFANGDPKTCGDDGCEGECGTCPGDKNCGLDFLCHSKDCKPACGSKKCGDDGCGGACGECADGDLCQPGGICKPGPCKGIPKQGKCDEGILISCQGEGATAQKVLLDCSTTGVDKVCGWDAPKAVNGCIDKPPCTPSCGLKDGGKKQCGSDGCDGKCGVCPSGWSCPGGLCKAEEGGDCGFLPAQGKCEGNTWVFCNTGKIKVIDCGKFGQKCAYDGSKFTCK